MKKEEITAILKNLTDIEQERKKMVTEKLAEFITAIGGDPAILEEKGLPKVIALPGTIGTEAVITATSFFEMAGILVLQNEKIDSIYFSWVDPFIRYSNFEIDYGGNMYPEKAYKIKIKT